MHRSPDSHTDVPTTVEQLLAAARATLRRLTPEAAHAAMRDGATLIDIRSDNQRLTDGLIPGAHIVARNVLEWRLDPSCSYRDTELAGGDELLVLICDEGFQSSLAAAIVQRLGARPVTDVIGGFRAWRAVGLPVQKGPAMPATATGAEPPVDVDVLRHEIEKTYTEVSTEPEQDFVFPTGRGWARELGYPEPELARVPEASAASFAGVANHWQHGRVQPGEVVLDLGCGAGTDLLIAAQMTGSSGRAVGIDMTTSMLDRARLSAQAMGLTNVELHESLIEHLPLATGSVDVVISNGVIDLVPDKDAVFAEIDRVLRPGGRLQLADVFIRHEVSEDARQRIDLWTG